MTKITCFEFMKLDTCNCRVNLGFILKEILPYSDVIDRLSNKARRILDIVKTYPGINAKEIQSKLNFESGHTFGRHMKQLLNNNLVEFQRNQKDKRQKKYQLTVKGQRVQELIIKYYLKISLKYFFDYCERLFLSSNPHLINSEELSRFREMGYSDELIEELENVVFIYLEKCLTEIREELPFKFSRDAIITSISKFKDYYKDYYEKLIQKESIKKEKELSENIIYKIAED